MAVDSVVNRTADYSGVKDDANDIVNQTPFSIPVRINYEDTDAGGVVYYANYLGFMERARNACLREHGFPLGELQSTHNLVFVVAHVDIRYRSPARLDDLLEVNLRLIDIRGASLRFLQQVIRNGEILVEATLKLATIRADTFSPCRIPDALRRSFD